jgi:hypothetical protein
VRAGGLLERDDWNRPRSAAKCLQILDQPAKVGDQWRGKVLHQVKNKQQTLLQDWQRKLEDTDVWTAYHKEKDMNSERKVLQWQSPPDIVLRWENHLLTKITTICEPNPNKK